MSDTDSTSRWNARYLERPNRLFQPETYLVEKLALFRAGSVMDVACGDGRNAIYLAQQGYNVTGVDFSIEGLNRLKGFASEAGVTIHTKVLNVDNASQFSQLGRYDNAIFVHFKPSVQTFAAVSELLRPHGVLCMTSFNTAHRISSPNFPAAFCHEEGEFLNRTQCLELVEYVSYQDTCGKFDGYIFRKCADY
ncbi:bifunctional 2-polyprenyl-6-hydroxyphenol methylase/3-demethylubiquinol 3-O-methyltransferase UbiG [Alicyclobacillus sp. SO9]|uniref:class I SAM-dependent methyltransferase n=1 Tax=Alicyclobacillus sp. SO9 TaxID=2665646 RepID=UPI0018E7BBE4|nr:class I SAM-dependent methyltransferase [Alicyclobacillus sp. SO9]QQE78576.1 class I SAM-dependent methyltransferase [Alicyclobacillus sp. SO9]